MIMRVVPSQGFTSPLGTAEFLAYLHRFDIDPPRGSIGPCRDPHTDMYRLKRARRSDNTMIGDVVSLDQLRVSVEISPRFGKQADHRLTKETSLDIPEHFWLTKYYNKELFFALSSRRRR
jgi:hypothetical protein